MIRFSSTKIILSVLMMLLFVWFGFKKQKTWIHRLRWWYR